MRKKYIFLDYYYPKYPREKIKKMADIMGTNIEESSRGRYSCIFELYEDSPEYELFLKTTKELKMLEQPSRVEVEWSTKELLSAVLIHMAVAIDGGPGGDSYGTQYDKSTACPKCRVGATQISDLIIDKKKVGNKNIALTHDFDVIVSEKFKSLVESYGLTGATFRATKDKSGRDDIFPGSYQLFVTSVLPPMASDVKFEKEKGRYCKKCGKMALFLRSRHHYKKSDLKALCDFNATHEWFGAGVPTLPHPHILVRPSVYEMCQEHKIKGIDWYVVQVD